MWSDLQKSKEWHQSLWSYDLMALYNQFIIIIIIIDLFQH